MSENVDVAQANGLLTWLGPDLAREEQALRAATPGIDDATALDGALRAALARLRVEVSRETFLYLQWRVETARLAARNTREAVDAARMARTQARLDRLEAAAARNVPRVIRDPAGQRWLVLETEPNDLFGAESPCWLVFHGAHERRSVRTYPAGWRTCPDEVLLALLPSA
jgi:hypothetical protein